MNTAHTDCYKLLGIASDAEPKVIQKAWRLKTKEIHPDINKSPTATADFRALTLAFKILIDPVARLKHDRQFGYGKQANNEFTIQTFSIAQNEKAKLTVNEWSSEYEIAMNMRDDQRNKNLTKHHRNIRQAKIIFAVSASLLLVLLILFIIN